MFDFWSFLISKCWVQLKVIVLEEIKSQQVKITVIKFMLAGPGVIWLKKTNQHYVAFFVFASLSKCWEQLTENKQ